MISRFIAQVRAAVPGGFAGLIRFNEPMAAHTTFKAGGPADCWVRPEGDCFPAFAAALRRLARREGVPVFTLGGGANLVVADAGIRGVVLDSGGWAGAELAPDGASSLVRSGYPGDALADAFADAGRGGLEFLAGMPGSVGGMVWMNARAMDRSVSDVLIETEILDESGERVPVPCTPEDFSYKKSPFQGRDTLILTARFRLGPRTAGDIRRETAEYRKLRTERGHFRAPSAGSAFKNNRALGRPTGQIIDELGLRGLRVGGAQVAPWHGNFIINTGGATARDIRELVDTVIAAVHSRLGVTLEPEILFVGDWGEA
jgi:UDP-N-acetylmuramate dehydrogenase